MTRLYPILFAALSVATLTACASNPAADLYVLRAPQSAPVKRCATAKSLAIARPIARGEYDTKRIAVMLSDTQLAYYTGATWASPFPDQLRDFMTDDFSSLASIRSDADAGGMVLQLSIQEASVVAADMPRVHLRMTAVLRDAGSNHRLATIAISESVQANANHMPDIVAAFDLAAANAARKIAQRFAPHCAVE